MKKLIFFLSIFLCTRAYAQNVGIGTTTPTLAKLVVKGVAGTGTTIAAFGTDGQGVSFQHNPLTIGFNQYRDNTVGNGRYMANGVAGTIAFDHSTGTMDFKIFNSGLKGNITDNGTSVFTILKNGSIGIGGSVSETMGLWVTKKPGDSGGGAVFEGTQYNSIINDLNGENTFVNAGRDAGKVIISDIPNGKTIIPNKTRIGTGGTLNPQTTLELFGALAITKEESIQICNETIYTYNPSNISRVKIEACFSSNTELRLGDGIIFGQILIINAGINYTGTQSGVGLIIKDAGNIDLQADYTMYMSHPDLILIWRKLPNNTGRWTQVNQVRPL